MMQRIEFFNIKLKPPEKREPMISKEYDSRQRELLNSLPETARVYKEGDYIFLAEEKLLSSYGYPTSLLVIPKQWIASEYFLREVKEELSEQRNSNR